MSQNLKFDEQEEFAPLPSFSSIQESNVGRSSISSNLWDNPMWAEIRRIGKRFITYDRMSGTRAAVSWLLAGAYFAFLLFAGIEAIRNGVHILTVLMPKLVLLVPMGVLMGYNLISGERERRSWDLLRTAPLSSSQLVLGKFAGLATTVTAISVLLSVPAMLSGRIYGRNRYVLDVGTWLIEEVSVWMMLMFVCSLSVGVSARSRRSLVSLASTVGILLGGYVGIPLLCALFIPWVLPILGQLLPLAEETGSSLSGPMPLGSPVMSIAFHACLIVVSLTFAVLTVRAVDRKDMQ